MERTDQIERLKKEAIYEMLHYHEKCGKQKVKDLMKKAAGRYVPPKDLISWPTGLLANTLSENYELWEEKETVLAALKEYFDRWLEIGAPIYFIDDVLCGTALLNLYRLSGEEKYKKGANKLAQYLYSIENVDRAGSIPYRPNQSNRYVFVDGIGMICPFLCRYGMEMGDETAISLAIKQLRNMLKYGMGERLWLPYHGFEYESRTKYGIIGWGRAAGWLLAGMAGALSHLPKEHEAFVELQNSFMKIVISTANYQKENGAFAWQLEALGGPEDSSAAAMIGQAVLSAQRCGVIKNNAEENICRELVQRAAEYIAGCEQEGKIYGCSGECIGFAQYPQVYGAYPWSLGPGLALLLCTLK